MYVVQDIMVRHARMSGKKTLWLPGTDHAAIATQNRVEKDLAKRTPPLTRYDLGREKFVQQVEEFVEQSRDTIRHQLRTMGFSLDWSRETFTLDAPRQAAVTEMFIRMYHDGLIYRGNRIVNWCPRCQSTLADDEVEYREEITKFYYFKYGPVVIGTARPETKFLDKTIVVHPDDPRYTTLHNTTLTVEWMNGPVQAQVIADATADKDFGSGAMTITPAHSKEDFALAQKYHLPIVQIIDEAGNFTEAAGTFAGQSASASRQTIVDMLASKGLVDHIDDHYTHNLSVCYRCGTAIQPLLSDQWFVHVDQPLPAQHQFAGKTLKQVACEVVNNGSIQIIPDRFTSTYFHWMDSLHNWCISRQLWYGHRIPAWYKDGAITVQVDSPGQGWKQDSDVLDTWFSSGMWTFSTLGWPRQTEDLTTFHPTQVLETGYDILFFWVARMILMTTYALGEIPFEKVYLHGLVRDKLGRKMSKSLGNGIDPLDMSAKYGTDALRMALIAGTTPGNDAKLYEEKIASYRNFITKIWNVGRYILANTNLVGTGLSLSDQWILSRLNRLVMNVNHDFETYQYSLAAERTYDFLWHELADWYVEIKKFEPNPGLLQQVLEVILKVLHPFVPFVTEVLWQEFKPGSMLITAAWPIADAAQIDPVVEQQFVAVQDSVIQLRNLRNQYNISYQTVLSVYSQQLPDSATKTMIEQLAKVSITDQLPIGQLTHLTNSRFDFGVELSVVIDVVAERQRLQKEIIALEKNLASFEAKLNNPDFLAHAPNDLIENTKKLRDEKLTVLAENKSNLSLLPAALQPPK